MKYYSCRKSLAIYNFYIILNQKVNRNNGVTYVGLMSNIFLTSDMCLACLGRMIGEGGPPNKSNNKTLRFN